MDQPMVRRYCLDGDVCEVTFYYDEFCQKCFGEYPDFEETPRYTPRGRPWVTVMQEGCRHGKNRYHSEGSCLDCGSCQYFMQEKERDLIGICVNDYNQKSEECRQERRAVRPVSVIKEQRRG